ncbi:MAG: crossover junction endodeoxyribonuclease RuvC [Bacteroidales bacterium]|nr:crossover junction endodeoxyribonuclease RuvC [Bacteroidales bacterium]
MENEGDIILGIDPGTLVMGYALLKTNAVKSELITLDVLTIKHLDNQPAKLKLIFEFVQQLIDQYHPNILAIEAPFLGKSAQSMLKLGRAQGVVIAASINKGLEINEYSPRKIKMSVTGNGNAAKEQVSAMLHRMYTIPDDIKYFDATDALAVAVCHHLQNRVQLGTRQQHFSGWESFLSKNADRIVKK